MVATLTSPSPRRLLRKFSLLWRAPHRGEWFSRWLVKVLAVAVLLPSLAMWFEPFLLPYAVGLLIFTTGLTVWWQWLGKEHFGAWLAGAFNLTLFWSSGFTFWLFLENTRYRLLWLALLLVFSWWYLTEWQRLRQKLFIGESLVASAPNLSLGFLTTLALGVTAEGSLVYLNTPLAWLWLLCYGPMVVSFLALCQLSGWAPFTRWVYPLTAAVVLAQVFAVVTWWPTSFYVAGFALAVCYLVVAAVIRQEVQGFVNRRSLMRELGVLLGCLTFALLFARWT